MSNLISSFIDPVFRQARRFSGALPPSERVQVARDVPQPSLSHANPQSPPSPPPPPPPFLDSGDEGHSPPSNASSPSLIDYFRRSTADAPPPTTPTRAERDAVGHGLDMVGGDQGTEGSGHHDGTVQPSLSSPPAASSPDQHRPPPPLGAPALSGLVDVPADSTMSQNPSYSLHNQLEQLTLTSPSLPIPTGRGRPFADEEASLRDGGPTAATTPAAMSESLPADDGMRHLRARIQQIWALSVSNEEKARLMHTLMMERYNTFRPQSPSSFISQERPFTPTSGQSVFSDVHVSSPHSPTSEADPLNPFNLSSKDTEPTFWIPPPSNDTDNTGECDDSDASEDGQSFGCEHYKRNVKVQCFECRRWYTCRHCHDSMEAHNLNRKKTENMLCMACGTPQPAASTCTHCGLEAAWYYCDTCKLWDDDISKKIYHCVDCGICRRGAGIGKDYIHCKKCNVCIAIRYAEDHKCIERATDCDCPICGEYLFNSQSAVISIRCGHYLHKACYDKYMETAYKCPICQKSAVTMELQWRKLTEAIESQPMPEQFADTRAVIHCNDCSGKSSVKYHWLGNKCNTCGSYNTNELQILEGPKSEETANAILTAESNQAPEQTPLTAVSPAQRPLRSPEAYFRSEHPVETWLPEQFSFPFQMPQMPQLPQMPRMPQLPQMPQFPTMPQLPTLPQMPQMPQVPDPYEMLERVRAFSPFRNYLNPSAGTIPHIDLSDPLDTESVNPSLEVRQPSLSQYVLERFSRSLSPLRGYLNPPNDNIPDLDLTESRDEDHGGFWGIDGTRFGLSSGGEEDDEEDDASDSDDSFDDEDQDVEGEEDDDDEDDERDFALPGHR